MQSNSLKDLLQNKIDDMEKQVLSRVNTLEESKGGAPRNDSEQRNKVESTLTSLHHRITDLEKGAFAPRLPASSLERIYLTAAPGRRLRAAALRIFQQPFRSLSTGEQGSRTAHARKLCRARLALRICAGFHHRACVRAHSAVKW